MKFWSICRASSASAGCWLGSAHDAALGRLVVEGFRSIRRLELDLTTDVTVLIGANGSGKSNLVSALEPGHPSLQRLGRLRLG